MQRPRALQVAYTTIAARISSGSGVPRVRSNANGMIETRLNQQTKVLTWIGSYSGQRGTTAAGNIHGPGSVLAGAGMVVARTAVLTSPIKISETLTSTQSAVLMAGIWRINARTDVDVGGEIRGELALDP